MVYGRYNYSIHGVYKPTDSAMWKSADVFPMVFPRFPINGLPKSARFYVYVCDRSRDASIKATE